MAQPQNGIIGDGAYGTELPQTEVPEQDLSREQSMARFSKSREFKALEAAINSRIEYYQAYLPGEGNIKVNQMSNAERGYAWLAADTIISEFRSILGAYEQAAEAVKDAK